MIILKLVGGTFLTVLAVSLYYKLVKFLFTFPFPCHGHFYRNCVDAEVLGLLTTMFTLIVVGIYLASKYD